MDLRFKTNLLEHSKVVSAWAHHREAQATVDLSSFELLVRRGEVEHRFHAQFAIRSADGRLAYAAQPDPFPAGFVGWLPYRVAQWDIAASKVTFKALARELGIATPKLWLQVDEVDAPYLVKLARSSFGIGMRGPYPASAAPGLRLRQGEYCEEFKWGRIARAWYWSGELDALELIDMPTLEGDGRRSYLQLLQDAAPEMNPHEVQPLAAIQGVALDDVPAPGRKVICDYRYLSPFNPTVYANSNVLRASAPAAATERFREAGRKLLPHVARLQPEAKAVGFVLDAIVDEHDQPWVLEINSNPQWHPDANWGMLDSWFGIAGEQPT
jgi:hypothetical protein